MNEIIFGLAFSLLIFTTVGNSQTTGKRVKLGDEFSLTATQKALVKSETFEIKFLSVVEDSRCPPDVDCIWAGNAKVKVLLKKGNRTSREFELNTNLEPKTIEFEGLEIEFLSLSDNPAWAPENKSSKYVAGFIVQKQ
jgi:hypothetical protein